jgi:coenzyme F420-reducing hydrogenase delta subunit
LNDGKSIKNKFYFINNITMKLTREQWEKLDDMTLKERVERLEELVDEIETEQSRIRMKEFEKELDKINDEADTKCIWALVVSMILV